MDTPFPQALIAGFERVAAWADLLDEINVFPVADGDTGRNLVVSLSPLRQADQGRDRMIRELLLSARGNSGNIAARFLSGLLAAESAGNLADGVRRGRELARQAVHDPKPGTMLTVFDVLAEAMANHPVTEDGGWREPVIQRLEEAVLSTPELLPRLKAAGVVDAGALGAFIFLEGFFSVIAGDSYGFRPITETFKNYLKVSPAFSEGVETGCCVDMVLRVEGEAADDLRGISAVGESVVALRDGDYLKVHLHTRDGRKARNDLAAFGKEVRWFSDDLGEQVRSRRQAADQAVHVVTDAAGSISREAATELGATVLSSYITVGERSLPETHFAPEELYEAMRRGVRVSTAQASLFERHQHYRSLLDRHPRVLYLCVGSAFTGNCAEAMAWQRRHDPEGRFTIVDSGAASGRLGLPALALARFARETGDAETVIRFAQEAAARCQEYVFLDTLRYLAAGGRLSRTNAFFGDLMHMKPVISPVSEGAKKVGIVRNRAEQLKFALEKLEAALGNRDELVRGRKPVTPAEARVHNMPISMDSHACPGLRSGIRGNDNPGSMLTFDEVVKRDSAETSEGGEPADRKRAGAGEAGPLEDGKQVPGPDKEGRAMIMIEYTDNLDWVTKEAQPEIARICPCAEIILQPMSLTSGAHMGPGTWGVAFLPLCGK